MLVLVNLLQEGYVGNKGRHLELTVYACMNPNVADFAFLAFLAKGIQTVGTDPRKWRYHWTSWLR